MKEQGLARFLRLQAIRGIYKDGTISREDAIEVLSGPLTPGDESTIVDDSKMLDADGVVGWMLFEDAQPLDALRFTLDVIRYRKPNDRSEKDRYTAIAITDLEKVIAFYEKYVIS